MINYFIANFSENIDIAIFLIAMIPTLECRIAIPFGFSFSDFSAIKIFLLAFLGSIVPIIPIIASIKLIRKKVKNKVFYNKIIEKYSTKISKINKKHSLLKKYLYLTFFVALPLPLTGVWSGSLIAGIINLPTLGSFYAISIGSLIATGIMLICSILFGNSVIYLLIISLILIIIFMFFALLKKTRRK